MSFKNKNKNIFLAKFIRAIATLEIQFTDLYGYFRV